MIRWFHVEPQGVDPCAYVPGLYTQSQVDDLINIDGYIPVADADEFDKISTGAVETMGGCSIWAGSYTTGRDKQYIQIFDIDFAVFGPFTPIGIGQLTNNFEGTYDGNNFNVSNVTIPSVSYASLFGNCTATTIRNLTCVNFDIKGLVAAAPLVAQHVGAGACIVDNCHSVDCTITSNSGAQAILGGLIGQNNIPASVTVTDCTVTNFAISTSLGSSALSSVNTLVGGFIGDNRVGSTITNCHVNGFTVNQKFTQMGGFIGGQGSDAIEGGVIDFCSATNIAALHGHSYVGGFIGRTAGSVSNCYTDCPSVTSDNREVGGFVGWVAKIAAQITPIVIDSCYSEGSVTGLAQFGAGGFCGRINTAGTIRNCYSRGNVIGATQVGGFIGRVNVGTVENSYCTGTSNLTANGFTSAVLTGGSVTNSYWDTTTSGKATSAGGTGQTTVALQTPTSNTGIYSAWSLAIWDFGTSTDYPELINTP